MCNSRPKRHPRQVIGLQPCREFLKKEGMGCEILTSDALRNKLRDMIRDALNKAVTLGWQIPDAVWSAGSDSSEGRRVASQEHGRVEQAHIYPMHFLETSSDKVPIRMQCGAALRSNGMNPSPPSLLLGQFAALQATSVAHLTVALSSLTGLTPLGESDSRDIQA